MNEFAEFVAHLPAWIWLIVMAVTLIMMAWGHRGECLCPICDPDHTMARKQ